MEAKKTARRITDDLLAMGDDALRLSSRRFFKEEIKCHGIKAARVRAYTGIILKEISGQSKGHVFDLCELLWSEGFLEETLSHVI